MRNVIKYFVYLVVCLMAFTISAVKGNSEETIVGWVEGVDWDEEDNVTAIAISVVVDQGTEEEYFEEYLVKETELSRPLWQLIGKRVKAVGIITSDSDGNKFIEIKKYELIKNDAK